MLYNFKSFTQCNAFNLYNEQSSYGLKLYHSQWHISGPPCLYLLIQISRVLNHVLALVRISCRKLPFLFSDPECFVFAPKICDPWHSSRLLYPAFPKLGIFSVHVIWGFGNWAKLRTNHIWEPPFPDHAKYVLQISPRGHLNSRDPLWAMTWHDP